MTVENLIRKGCKIRWDCRTVQAPADGDAGWRYCEPDGTGSIILPNGESIAFKVGNMENAIREVETLITSHLAQGR